MKPHILPVVFSGSLVLAAPIFAQEPAPETPAVVGRVVMPDEKQPAPLATEDWFNDPSANVVLTNWPITSDTEFPAPGMVVSSNRAGNNTVRAGSGHVGIVDYDGAWINAGSKTVNKYVVPGDAEYAPVHYRNNQ